MNLNQTIQILIVLLLCGCTDDHSFVPEEGNAIRFRTATFSTRTAAYTQDGATYYPSMGMYASASTAEGLSTGAWNLFENQPITRTSNDNVWSYTPFKNWTYGCKYTFFAYAPWHDSADTSNMRVINDSGTPQIAYTIADKFTQQEDLLIAVSIKEMDPVQDRVNLLFHHAFTRISFWARTANSIHAQADLKVIAIKLSGLHNQGRREMDASAGITWGALTPVSTSSGTYSLTHAITPEKGGLIDTPLNASAPTTLTDTDGSLFLMPQTLPEEATLEITFRLFRKGTDTPFDPDDTGPLTDAPIVQTVKLTDVMDTWQAGEHIRFLLTLPNPVTPATFAINYEHVPWDEVEISVDEDPDPFLDISNLTATTYDAAATRIYFYTKIGSGEHLYIEPTGVDADGNVISVNSEFVKLANDGSNNPSNLYYDYNPANGSGSGSGYIDLINHPTGRAASAGNSQQKPITLVLCAGKLRRTLTVTPRVSAFALQKDDQPYIGTFHRADETGERIVTWHAEGDWTATILPTPGTHHADLRIDHMVSPAMMDGSLYTNHSLSAEGALVGDGGRSLNGSGRVYFRVGWNGRTTANRYAMIRVNYIDRKGPATITLYCRQGEKSDPISATAPPLATYNIDTPERWVAYPTQTGSLYQWNTTTSLSPLIPGTPPGFVVTPINKAYDLNNYICPDTYSYPDDAAARSLHSMLNPSAMQYGYYADGYFDRRTLANHQTGDHTSAHPLASGGWMITNAANARSLFLPASGQHDASGQWIGEERKGGYWTLLSGEELISPFFPSDNSKALALLLQANEPNAALTSIDKRSALSVRCVRMEGHTLFFDANGGRFRLRSITATGSISLPTEAIVTSAAGYVPNLPDNEFGGWKTDPLGNTADVGATFTPTGDTYLYAHWLTPLIVDYQAMATENSSSTYFNFFLQSSVLTSYYNRTVNDVTTYTAGSTAAMEEKAYPRVLFHSTTSETPLTFAAGYAYCANLAPQGTWRMPRISELLSLCYYKIDMAQLVFDDKILWSGTSKKGNTDAFTQHFTATAYDNASNKQTLHYVRCVQEMSTSKRKKAGKQ